ncbi:MAG TPA: hypothetical protein VN213_16325 [Solirubrobacteraceae bacterium]|nr:hypothetical protein [Solirubrobacteraceae bacterium]
MAVWTLIAVAVGMCWTGILVLGWLLCRAAQRGDEGARYATVVPLRPDRRASAVQRR